MNLTRRRLRFCPLFVLLLLNTSFFAHAEEGKADYQACISCHGANGEGNAALNGPALAGQDAAYLARQLRHFKEGVRGGNPNDALGMQMRAMVMTLSGEEAIDRVASYLSSLPPPAVEVAAGDFNKRNGANQYNGYCGACHGATAEGNAILNAPRLAGLDVGYLQRQMQNFQNGVRGSAEGDRFGKQMAMMATTLPEKDLDDVLRFIHAAGATGE